jgi:hypothetical protein
MTKSYLDRQQNIWNEYNNNFLLAVNPNTPLETLELLATNKNSSVRCAVARNPNTSPKVLERLVADDSHWVRRGVARHPNTPHYIKKYLKIQKHLARL